MILADLAAIARSAFLREIGMSTVFLIKYADIETPYGFSKISHDTYVFYESDGYGKTQTLAETSEGEVVFPEDFPNKRAYLQKVKSKGWKKFSGNYRLTEETLVFIKKLGENTVYSLIDITDINDLVSEYIKISLSDLSTRSILKYGKYYIVSR